jgi:hypothetical protein
MSLPTRSICMFIVGQTEAENQKSPQSLSSEGKKYKIFFIFFSI